MSNIYIQEPPTNGKIVLRTTIGEIAIELWSKECPKACRNFVQLCMDNYYDGTIFHRVIKDFIAQGGDPTGTGQGGESIYGAPFKDEFHQRLRFNRRGLVAMANADKDDNGSQFFFTLAPCPELQKKHTIFGKVSGNTIYNMIKLNECEVINERPIRPEKIISSEVVYNPFEDIQPRNVRAPAAKTNDDDASKIKKGVKNFALLSFGDEAEEDEDNLETVSKEFKVKAKSAHDIGDPTLLAKSAKPLSKQGNSETSSSSTASGDDSSDSDSTTASDDDSHKKKTAKSVDIENIKSKLKKTAPSATSKIEPHLPPSVRLGKESEAQPLDAKELQKKQTQEEIKKIQKELLFSQKKATEEEKEKTIKVNEKRKETEVVKLYKEEVEKYDHLKKTKTKGKEDKTFEMLKAFRERLFKAKEEQEEEKESGEKPLSEKGTDTTNDDSGVNKSEASSDPLRLLFTHRLEVDDDIKQKVIDANIADNERYDIFDPRNPLNKRKREESRDLQREKKRQSGGSGASFASQPRNHSSSSRSHR